jgi:hypothetical protein
VWKEGLGVAEAARRFAKHLCGAVGELTAARLRVGVNIQEMFSWTW